MNQNPVGNISAEIHTLTEQAELAQLAVVEGQTFTDLRIVLDGSDWRNCRFLRCEIAVVLGAFRLDSKCRFVGCKIRYNGVAGRVYDLVAATPEQSRHARVNKK